ncbi:RbsD/FucU family protein [Palleronia sp. LCG004]|uniref:RbsD/FucU family protein n=1 Tax=Palleronia sp. LCG004 TaxID=3079304 RepID=UPI002942D259|nr:RbsD/FucU domain-containing protein [Palleronia sp. LCG004]WOI57188.1 RbsD/FucU domain-containing protein [Palleronia sp. LCG004]
MLKGIDPLIGPELLRALALMGHGDRIVVTDANFPAASVGNATVLGTALRMECDAPRALEAILSLMPLDTYIDDPVLTMQVVGDPNAMPEVVTDALPVFTREGAKPKGVERFEFYDMARRTFAVLRTTETRPYGNFILSKGVL